MVKSVEAGQQAAVLLGALDGKTCTLLRNFLALLLTKEKTFKDPVHTLKHHFEPKQLVIAEHFHFQHLYQGPGKAVADIIAVLT